MGELSEIHWPKSLLRTQEPFWGWPWRGCRSHRGAQRDGFLCCRVASHPRPRQSCSTTSVQVVFYGSDRATSLQLQPVWFTAFLGHQQSLLLSQLMLVQASKSYPSAYQIHNSVYTQTHGRRQEVHFAF